MSYGATSLPEPWSTARAEAIISEYRALEGPLLPLLHAFMKTFGAIPEPAIPLIAEALNLSRAEVHGVVTFYHDFRREPTGRHVIKVCRAESCQAMGGEALQAHLEQRLGIAMGETTLDGAITLEPVYCLGLCALSPAVLVNGEPVGRATQAELEARLAPFGASI